MLILGGRGGSSPAENDVLITDWVVRPVIFPEGPPPHPSPESSAYESEAPRLIVSDLGNILSV